MFTSTFFVLALSASAFANVFVTFPVATTTFHGGQQTTVSWQDDGKAPTLQAFGAAKVSIYAGNAQQQTLLQSISSSVDVSTTSSVQFTPDPSIGPNSAEYFIRVESLALKDATQTQYPALAFSAKFTMDGMTGTFTPAVQSQIDGQTTAPLTGGTTSGASSASSTPATTTTSTGAKATTSGSSSTKSGTATSSTAKSTSTSGALGHSTVSGVAVIAVAAAFGIALL
jgi:hypothetical protein